MSQQDMDRLRDMIATELGLARDGIGYEEAGVADEIVSKYVEPVIARVEASRRDWAAIAMTHDMAAEWQAVGTLDDPWPQDPSRGAPCSCLTPEGAALVAAQPKWSLPRCAVHPEADSEDGTLLAVAEARAAADTGERHSLDDVAREFGVDLGEVDRG